MNVELELPEPLKVDKGISRDLDKLEKLGDDIFTFDGLLPTKTVFQLYLLKKYKSKCIPYSFSKKDDRLLGITFALKLKYNNMENFFLEKQFINLAEIITNCIKRGEQTVIIPLSFRRENTSHANMLIYRKKTNELEHFEPHGGYYVHDSKLQDALKKVLIYFTNILSFELEKENLPPVKYIEASQVCPYFKGLQSIENKSKLLVSKKEPHGYCAVWSMFFMELCLKNPDISSKDILTNIFNYLTTKESAPDYLKKIARGYAGYVYEIIEKYLSVFFKKKLNTDYIRELHKKKDYDTFDKIVDVLNVLLLLEMKIILNPDFDLNDELKKTRKEFYKLTKGKTKEEIKNQMKTRILLRDLYYKKRILQNYEEYNKYDKVSEPIFDSPLEIKKEDIKNINVLKKTLEPPKKVVTHKKKSPNSKTIKATQKERDLYRQHKLMKNLESQVGKDKTELIQTIAKQNKINLNTEAGNTKLLDILKNLKNNI